MRSWTCIFLLAAVCASAQDRLYLRDGTVRKGTAESVTRDAIYFRMREDEPASRISRSQALVLERDDGSRHVFGAATKKAADTSVAKGARNILFAAPFGLITGRATIGYERISPNGRVGYVPTVSLTFDPLGFFSNSNLDTTGAVRRIRGMSFIAGGDVNFYFGPRPRTRFFIGPRLRYGTDLFLRRTTALTAQTQIGWRFSGKETPLVQHLSFGFGFAQIFASPAGRLISPAQYYGWYSLNYRLGISW